MASRSGPRSATRRCLLDYVNRQFKPRARMRCGSLTSPMWRPGGLRLRRLRHRRIRAAIVGWRVGRTAHAGLVLDALEEVCMTGGLCIAAGLCITATEAANTSRSNTPIAWPKPASNLRWTALATATTMLWPRPSTVSTKPRSSIGAAVAVVRRCRVRNVGMGRLVQQSPAAGTHRQHPAGEAEKHYYAMLDRTAMAA